MKRYLFPIVIFFIGILVGATISIEIMNTTADKAARVEHFQEVSNLEDLSSRICETGNYQSSVIALKYLIDKLDAYEEVNQDKSSIMIDKGLAHGRLFILYKNNGEEELAQQEYVKAINLLQDSYHIRNENDLKKIIKRIGGARGSGPES